MFSFDNDYVLLPLGGKKQLLLRSQTSEYDLAVIH